MRIFPQIIFLIIFLAGCSSTGSNDSSVSSTSQHEVYVSVEGTKYSRDSESDIEFEDDVDSRAYDFDDYEATLSEAIRGYPEAQYDVAVMYSEGRGVPRNYDEAYKWYSMSARQGFAEAQYSLAQIHYDKGKIFPAYSWGYREGTGNQFVSGRVYYPVRTVSKDYIQSYIWASIAMSKGHREAAEMVEDLEQNIIIDSAEISRIQALTRRCFSSRYRDCEGK